MTRDDDGRPVARGRRAAGRAGASVPSPGRARRSSASTRRRSHATSSTGPTDRLPAIPSYELSGSSRWRRDGSRWRGRWALTPFDRDGVAAEYAVVPATVLAPKPRTLDARRERRRADGRPERLAGPVHGARAAARASSGASASAVTRAPPARTCRPRRRPARELARRSTLGRRIEPADLVFDTAGGDAARAAAIGAAASSRSPRSRRARTSTSSSSRTATSSSSSRGSSTRASCARRSTRCSARRCPRGVRAQHGPGKRGKVVLRVVD